jgi:hypothetical protein
MRSITNLGAERIGAAVKRDLHEVGTNQDLISSKAPSSRIGTNREILSQSIDDP